MNNNKREIDTYKSRQSNLQSGVLEQTDYSHFQPNSKQRGNGDDDGFIERGYKHGLPTRKREQAIDQVGGNWLVNGQHGGRVNNNPKKYDPSNKKQNFLQSSLDQHGYQPEEAPQEKYANNQYG